MVSKEDVVVDDLNMHAFHSRHDKNKQLHAMHRVPYL